MNLSIYIYIYTYSKYISGSVYLNGYLSRKTEAGRQLCPDGDAVVAHGGPCRTVGSLHGRGSRSNETSSKILFIQRLEAQSKIWGFRVFAWMVLGNDRIELEVYLERIKRACFTLAQRHRVVELELLITRQELFDPKPGHHVRQIRIALLKIISSHAKWLYERVSQEMRPRTSVACRSFQWVRWWQQTKSKRISNWPMGVDGPRPQGMGLKGVKMMG